MTDDHTPTEPTPTPTPTQSRRGLIRAGALAAAASAGAVVAAAGSAPEASAATGDTVKVGGSYTAANKATQLTVTGSTSTAALRLVNSTGPALALAKTTKDPSSLPPGSLAFAPSGLTVGLTDPDNVNYTSIVATYDDLAGFPVTVATTPIRILDTRSSTSRATIVGQSPASPFDSEGRLLAGAYIDVPVGDASSEDGTLQAVFLNVTAVSPLGTGYVVAYPSAASRPNASTVNFTSGVTLSNAAFVAVGQVGKNFAVRIYAQTTTHVILDLTGLTTDSLPGPAAPQAAARNVRSARTRPSARFTRALGTARRRS